MRDALKKTELDQATERAREALKLSFSVSRAFVPIIQPKSRTMYSVNRSMVRARERA